MDSERIVRSLLAALERSPRIDQPFAHFRIDRVFPDDIYRSMLSSFPAAELYHPLPHKDALRPDGTSTRLMFEFYDDEFARLPPSSAGIWSSVRDALYDRRVRLSIFGKFRPEIESRLHHPQAEMRLIGTHLEDLVAFPRPALYRDEAGYRITPHPDTPLKIATIQFYLPADSRQIDLGTSLYRRRRQVERWMAPWRGSYATVKKMPFLPNTGYGFAVTEKSFHGREPIRTPFEPRYSILLFYLREDVRLKY
jgi:hypothetical protein